MLQQIQITQNVKSVVKIFCFFVVAIVPLKLINQHAVISLSYTNNFLKFSTSSLKNTPSGHLPAKRDFSTLISFENIIKKQLSFK